MTLKVEIDHMLPEDVWNWIAYTLEDPDLHITRFSFPDQQTAIDDYLANQQELLRFFQRIKQRR